jgi:hypothetical protein
MQATAVKHFCNLTKSIIFQYEAEVSHSGFPTVLASSTPVRYP